VITGGADVDNIDAGGGDDTINVNLNDSETDVIQGGANTDTIVNMTPGVAVTINGFNAATQGIERWSGGNADIQGNANANVLNFQISASTTVVFSGVTAVRGLAGNDTITGTNAADIIYGGDDNDVISGLGGDDQLFGDAGADSLNGGAGADQLFGGDGVDTLTGGAGIDTFVFEDSIVDVTETDVIADFSNDRFRYVGYGPATNYATLVVSVPGGGPDTLITDSVTGKTIRLANVVKTKPQLPSSLFTFV